MGVIADSIKEKLTQSFNPSQLDVIDESHKHAGHAGAAAHAAKHGSGESHFHVRIVSPKFKGMSRLARHRAVMDVLADEMNGKVHALRLEAVAPE
ncbi:MAG: BolA family transcriptional regulator [Hyphomonadaceae bacterium]|nr:BolA family transcriptional regulator [Hyphomonadaceae bacterium]